MGEPARGVHRSVVPVGAGPVPPVVRVRPEVTGPVPVVHRVLAARGPGQDVAHPMLPAAIANAGVRSPEPPRAAGRGLSGTLVHAVPAPLRLPAVVVAGPRAPVEKARRIGGSRAVQPRRGVPRLVALRQAVRRHRWTGRDAAPLQGQGAWHDRERALQARRRGRRVPPARISLGPARVVLLAQPTATGLKTAPGVPLRAPTVLRTTGRGRTGGRVRGRPVVDPLRAGRGNDARTTPGMRSGAS